MEDFAQDVSSLSKILTDLINSSCAKVAESKFVTCDSQCEYLIWAIPPKTWHPLRRIVGKSPTGFLIVGKSLEDFSDYPNEATPQLTRYRNERVPVGTPLSQEVFYLTNSEPLQSYTGVSKDESKGKGCVTEWFISPENINPTSLQEARYFLSLYANALRSSLPPVEVWVCVDGNNTQEIAYLAMTPEETNSKLTNKDSDALGRKYMRHIIFTSRSEPITKKEDMPDLSSFMRHHLSCSSTSFVETRGYALHEVMGSSHSDNQECNNTRIALELTWNGVNSLLQPHPHSCDGVLHIKSVPGSVHLATHSLYLELKKVDHFSKILVDEEFPWPAPSTVDVDPVYSQMDAFFAKLNASNVFSPTVEQGIEEGDKGEPTFADATMAHLTFQEFARKDLDFTERLWLLLKDCFDEDDLTTSLQMCNVALFSGKCQPVVHSSNITSLAVFIRDLLQFETKEDQEKLQNRAKEFLHLDSAIKCLIEIGAEKLARDYTQYFIHEELATMGQLSSYLNSNVPLDTRVSNIKKLHQTLELVVTAKSVARLGHENLRSLTQSALTYYQTHPDSQQPMFSLSLPAFGSTAGAAIKSICATSNPSIWCAAIKSKTKTSSHATIVQLSTSHPGNVGDSEGHAYDISELNDDDFDPDKDKFQYFLSCAKQVLMPVIQ